MLLYLRGLGVDYRAARARLEAVRTFPFSSAKKRMSTLLRGRRRGSEGGITGATSHQGGAGGDLGLLLVVLSG